MPVSETLKMRDLAARRKVERERQTHDRVDGRVARSTRRGLWRFLRHDIDNGIHQQVARASQAAHDRFGDVGGEGE